MKLKYFNQDSNGAAEFAVYISSQEDIWHLYNLISVGDIVKCTATRKIVKETATGSASEKRKMTLSLQVNQPVDYDPNGILRVSGVNRTECEWVRLNAHHTSVIMWDPPQDVAVTKLEWDSLSEQRLKEACDEDGRADAAAVVMHNGLANVCLLNGTMCTVKAKVDTNIAKKRRGNADARDSSISKFFGTVLDSMVQHFNLDKIRVILLCSNGNVRDEFFEYLLNEGAKADAAPGIKALAQAKQKFLLVHVSSGHKHALMEALSNASVKQQMLNTRCLEDVKAWEEFQDMMNKDPDRCTYGAQPCFVAHAEHQALDCLLIADSVLRTTDVMERHFYAQFCEEVVECGGRVKILSTAQGSGERVMNLGGVAAILRQPLAGFEDEIEADENFTRGAVAKAFVASRLDAKKEGSMGPMARTRTGSNDAA